MSFDTHKQKPDPHIPHHIIFQVMDPDDVVEETRRGNPRPPVIANVCAMAPSCAPDAHALCVGSRAGSERHLHAPAIANERMQTEGGGNDVVSCPVQSAVYLFMQHCLRLGHQHLCTFMVTSASLGDVK